MIDMARQVGFAQCAKTLQREQKNWGEIFYLNMGRVLSVKVFGQQTENLESPASSSSRTFQLVASTDDFNRRWQHIGGTKERKGIKDLEATDKSEAPAAPNPKSSDPKQEVHAWGVAAAAVYECPAIKAEPEIMHSRNTVLEGEEAAVAVAEVFVSAVSSGTFLEYLFTVKIGDRTFTMEELLNPGGLFSWVHGN